MRIAKTLSAYIGRQFLVWFCTVFGAMVAIAFLLDFIELIRRAGTRAHVTLGVLLEMAALKLPETAQQILPFGILFGTMLAFWRLTRNNEMVVVRAAGVSVWQFLAPAVLAALIIGVLTVTVFNPVASVLTAAYDRMDSRVLHHGADEMLFSHAGLWLRQSDQADDQIIIHADRLASHRLRLDGVTFFFFNDFTQVTSRIDARTARLENGRWLIEDGTRWLSDGAPEKFAKLDLPTRLTPHKIEESFASPDTMSFWELPGYIALLEQSGFPAQRHRLHFDALLAQPFLLCAMVLVAATFSLRAQRRGGATLLIIAGVGCAFVLYFVSDVIYALGLSARVPVALAAWTPAAVSLVFGTSMLLHLEDG